MIYVRWLQVAEAAPFFLQSCGKDKASKDTGNFSTSVSQYKCTKQIHIFLRLLAANDLPLRVSPVAMERQKIRDLRDNMSEASNQQGNGEP